MDLPKLNALKVYHKLEILVEEGVLTGEYRYSSSRRTGFAKRYYRLNGAHERVTETRSVSNQEFLGMSIA